MSDWHWVQTHRLSGFADNAGHTTISDVLGGWKHHICVYADSSFQRPISINQARVYNDGQGISLTRVYYSLEFTIASLLTCVAPRRKAHVFDIQLGNSNQNHITLKLSTNRRNGPVHIAVWQHQRVVGRNDTRRRPSEPQRHMAQGPRTNGRPTHTSRPQFHQMPGGEACLCERCAALAGY
jgi:hypothetical protein